MLKSKIRQQLVPVLALLALISLVHWQLKFTLVFFWLGAVLGSFLLQLDQVIYCFFQAPHEFSSQRLKRLFEQKQYRQGLILLLETQEERGKLVFHSVLLQVILVVASFFVLSSTASLLGKGLVMGIFFQSLIEQGRVLKQSGQMNSWFWQLRIEVSPRLQVFYFLFMVLIFILFALFLI